MGLCPLRESTQERKEGETCGSVPIEAEHTGKEGGEGRLRGEGGGGVDSNMRGQGGVRLGEADGSSTAPG